MVELRLVFAQLHVFLAQVVHFLLVVVQYSGKSLDRLQDQLRRLVDYNLLFSHVWLLEVFDTLPHNGYLGNLAAE